MERGDAAVWELARKLFRSEETDRYWSSGLHAEHLKRDGYRVASEEEKQAYYDRALAILEARHPSSDG